MSLTDDIVRIVHKATSRTRTQVGMMLARIVVNAVNDGGGIQVVGATALAGEALDDIPHLQPGGLSHAALSGAEGVLLCIGGSRDNPVALGVANRGSRPTDGVAGETILYAIGPLAGQLRVKPTGTVEAVATGNTTADDFVAMAGKVLTELAAIKTAHDTHTHTVPITGPLGTTASTAPLVPMPAPSAVPSSNLKADN